MARENDNRQPDRHEGSTEAANMIGAEIGNYRILEKLGEGGMGVVYKALDTSLDRMVAMKVLSADLSRNPELVERFRAEARAQANLNHTNLATLYAFLIYEGNAYMVMEYIEGETFESMIRRRGPIPENDSLPLFKQALLGIGYAHRAGIIHRDIKPSNIMLNKYGIVKVMDFGIAKVIGARSMTRTGTQMGTVAYMSPEQIQNRPVDIRTDIYALGITLYEMLSGHLPFDSDSDFKVMQDQVATPPPLPTRYYPYIPKGLENVVLKALEKDPSARYQTVEEFGAAIEHPDTVATVAHVPPPIPVTAPQPIAPLPSRGTVLEAPSTLAPPAPAPLPPVSMPLGAAVQLPQPVPKAPSRAGSNPKLAMILVVAAVFLLALIAFAIYNAMSPTPHPRVAVVTQTPTTGQNSSPAQVAPSEPEDSQPSVEPPPVAAPPAAKKAAANPPRQSQQQNSAPPSAPAAPPPLPSNYPSNRLPPGTASLNIPAGAIVSVIISDPVDSSIDRPGQLFRASIAGPVWVGNQALVYKGADARVRLDLAAGSDFQIRLVSLNARGTICNVISRVATHGTTVRIPSNTKLDFALANPIAVPFTK
jgi:serine/threonine-protein kinase